MSIYTFRAPNRLSVDQTLTDHFGAAYRREAIRTTAQLIVALAQHPCAGHRAISRFQLASRMIDHATEQRTGSWLDLSLSARYVENGDLVLVEPQTDRESYLDRMATTWPLDHIESTPLHATGPVYQWQLDTPLLGVMPLSWYNLEAVSQQAADEPDFLYDLGLEIVSEPVSPDRMPTSIVNRKAGGPAST